MIVSQPYQRPGRSVEVAVLVALIFFFSLQEAMLTPAFPIILKSFNASPSQSGWFTGAALLGATVMIPLLGRVGDLFDKGWLVLMASVVAISGSVVCIFADTFTAMLAGQSLIGLSYALHPLGIGLMAELLPKEKVVTGTGFVIGSAVAGTTLGIILSGPIVDLWGIHGIYLAPMGFLIALAVTLLYIQVQARKPLRNTLSTARVDWMGWILLCICTSLLTIGTGRGAESGWNSLPAYGPLGIAAIAFIALTVVESRHPSPLIDLQVFLMRRIRMICVMAFALGGASIAPGMLIPLIVQGDKAAGGLGLGVSDTGIYLVALGVAASCAAPFGGALRRITDTRGLLVLANALIALGTLSLYLLHESGVEIVLGMILVGLGLGLGSAESMNAIIENTNPERTTSAASINYVIKSTSGVVIAQLCASFLRGTVNSEAHNLNPGYRAAFIFCVAVSLVGVIAALLYHAPHTSQAQAQQA